MLKMRQTFIEKQYLLIRTSIITVRVVQKVRILTSQVGNAIIVGRF